MDESAGDIFHENPPIRSEASGSKDFGSELHSPGSPEFRSTADIHVRAHSPNTVEDAVFPHDLELCQLAATGGASGRAPSGRTRFRSAWPSCSWDARRPYGPAHLATVQQGSSATRHPGQGRVLPTPVKRREFGFGEGSYPSPKQETSSGFGFAPPNLKKSPPQKKEEKSKNDKNEKETPPKKCAKKEK